MKRLKQEAGTAARFIMVGAINTLFGAGLMFILYNLAGCSYWLSSAANYFFGSILSYVLNRKFTFRHSGAIAGSTIRFIINIAACYLLAYGIARPLMSEMLENSSLTVQENVAMLAGMVLFTGLNYLGQRLFVFRRSGEETEQ